MIQNPQAIAPIRSAPLPPLRIEVLRKTANYSKMDVDASTLSTSFISRMYSTQLPGHSTPGPQLNAGLRQELDGHIINTDTNFITSFLFPASRLPFPIDDDLFTKISTSHVISEGKTIPAIWNNIHYQPRRFPTKFSEMAVSQWLNGIGEALAHSTGSKLRRVWSQRNCDKPPDGSNIKWKPDIILVNKDYLEQISAVNAPSDWIFIQALCEVTTQEKTSTRILDTINAKSFILFATQHNRRFMHYPSLAIKHSGSQFQTAKARYGTTKQFWMGNDPAFYSSLS